MALDNEDDLVLSVDARTHTQAALPIQSLSLSEPCLEPGSWTAVTAARTNEVNRMKAARGLQAESIDVSLFVHVRTHTEALRTSDPIRKNIL